MYTYLCSFTGVCLIIIIIIIIIVVLSTLCFVLCTSLCNSVHRLLLTMLYYVHVCALLQGTFSSGNAISCTLCPAGNACASTDLPLPVPYSQGSYAEEGQTVGTQTHTHTNTHTYACTYTLSHTHTHHTDTHAPHIHTHVPTLSHACTYMYTSSGHTITALFLLCCRVVLHVLLDSLVSIPQPRTLNFVPRAHTALLEWLTVCCVLRGGRVHQL